MIAFIATFVIVAAVLIAAIEIADRRRTATKARIWNATHRNHVGHTQFKPNARNVPGDN